MFAFLSAQVHISAGADVFIEKNTIVTENLSQAVSGLSAGQSLKIPSFKQKYYKQKSEHKKKRASKNAFSLSKNIKKGERIKHKTAVLRFGLLFNDSGSHHYAISETSQKPVISPEYHLKWATPEKIQIFSTFLSISIRKSFYTSQRTLIPLDECLRTRPPPV